ncbi:hypothetical protein BGW38_001454 [Lunasporangiospora selenospora]|uniref:Cns1/TTC4 wheel domain-containing protein n=1 Tax=Lunasporangiospora selenospora TaxID=979761 RepID=A0A9P6G2I8_9FUNG|nr:hypothetical protein BGW38_001454 [Lunasporangiospora selenospora]
MTTEVAENFKNQGNECFKQGKQFYKDALLYYTNGIDIDCSDDKLNETLYVNRAACNLHFGNYRRVLTDCAHALKLNPKNVKALFRSAKALAALEMYKEAIDCCEHALNADPDNQPAKDELKKITTEFEQKEAIRIAREQREQRIREKKLKLERALEKRKIRTAATPDFKSEHNHEIELDEDMDQIKVPTFFLYPEHNESDFIQAFNEQDAIGEQLGEIFYEAAPWDPDHKYKPETVQTYFETEDSGGNIGLMKVGLNVKLLTVLSHSKHVLRDGIARFIVVPKEDSKWKKDWLANTQPYKMHHGKHFRRLNRTSSHRNSMLRNLATQLIQHDRIKTTLPKAQELKAIADQMITLGKRGDLHAKVQAAAYLREHPTTLPKLFGPLAERFKRRKGGYTRIHKLGNRFGDNAPVAVIELIDGPGDLKNQYLFRALARTEKQTPGSIAEIVQAIQEKNEKKEKGLVTTAAFSNKSLARHLPKVMATNKWGLSELEEQIRKLSIGNQDNKVFDATSTKE